MMESLASSNAFSRSKKIAMGSFFSVLGSFMFSSVRSVLRQSSVPRSVQNARMFGCSGPYLYWRRGSTILSINLSTVQRRDIGLGVFG